jgi:hypothetical protein
MSLFKIRLANSKFEPSYQIRDKPTFSPSLSDESSTVSIRGSLPKATMASADFLALLTRNIQDLPPEKAFSFIQSLRHQLPNDFGVLRTLQRCACLSSFHSLICHFCSPVPDFAVPLPSLHSSRKTNLRLVNNFGRYPGVYGT